MPRCAILAMAAALNTRAHYTSTDSTQKCFLITGSTDGIGKFTAQRCASAGHHVIIHGRQEAKVAALVTEIQENGGSADGYVADLSSIDQVRSLGEKVRAAYPVLDGLLNNAGTFDGDYSGKRQTTVDGNEYSLAVNVLAPFLLTSILLDNVRASKAGRILVTSSISMGSADALYDLQCDRRWSAHRAYSLSKLCDAMIAIELDHRYGDPPRLCINTMDPGTVNTKMLQAGWGLCGIPVSRATRSFEMLTSSDWGQKSGEVAGAWADPEVKDPKARAKLWDELTSLTGARYPEPTRAEFLRSD